MKMEIKEVEIKKIVNNPYQTREFIEEEPLKVLITSIRERGLINPITVLKEKENFVIVSGHRRFEAFKKMRKKTIPAIVKKRNINNDLLVDLVHENLIREDLNPVEKAKSIKLLLSQIKSTRNDLSRMKTLINLLKNYKKRGYIPEHKRKQTEGFEDNDIFRLDKILKSLGISENTVITYLVVLELPIHVRKCLRLNKRSISNEGKITVKQAEQLVRVKDPRYQEYLFGRAMEGATVKAIQANANLYIQKTERGEWKDFVKPKHNSLGKFKDDLKKLENLSEEARKLSARISSFRVDTLIKIDETLEKEEFISSSLDLKRQLELLLNRINEKLIDKGHKPVKEKIESFEIVVSLAGGKKHFRYTLPMKIAKKLGLSKDKKEFLKLKIIGRRT